MTESKLQQRIAELETQNLALIEENQKLREALGFQSEIVVAPIQEPSLFAQEIEIQHTEKTKYSGFLQ
jgi:regulator of replication initiation timing